MMDEDEIMYNIETIDRAIQHLNLAKNDFLDGTYADMTAYEPRSSLVPPPPRERGKGQLCYAFSLINRLFKPYNEPPVMRYLEPHKTKRD